MKTLIVACAGGRRINNRPVCLNRHPDGKLLAVKCLEGIFAEKYNRILFAVNKDDVKEYNIDEEILQATTGLKNVEIAIVEKKAGGPAETVYETILQKKVGGQFAVRDCLNTIQVQENPEGNFVTGLDLTKYHDDVYKTRTKSFIIINEQDIVLDIIEKKYRSDVISVGLYGFKSAKEYVNAYEKLIQGEYGCEKLYISNVISYVLGISKEPFRCYFTLQHEDWGYPATWNRIQKQYANVIVDADQLLKSELDEDNVNELVKYLSGERMSKMRISLLTRNAHLDAKKIQDFLYDRGIPCVGVCAKMSYSKVVLVSDIEELTSLAMEENN